MIEEYRGNYSGRGSDFGKKRADLAYEVLNKFCDGGPNEQYANNDTGLLIGDLLLEPTRQEGNEAGGDLQQILLESAGTVVIMIEQALALADLPSGF